HFDPERVPRHVRVLPREVQERRDLAALADGAKLEQPRQPPRRFEVPDVRLDRSEAQRRRPVAPRDLRPRAPPPPLPHHGARAAPPPHPPRAPAPGLAGARAGAAFCAGLLGALGALLGPTGLTADPRTTPSSGGALFGTSAIRDRTITAAPSPRP